MTREQLEHVIRASGAIVNEDELIIIGSQSILAQFPHAPMELLKSMEADLYPKQNPALAIHIDGAIGEMSPFHETFGYYAHGIGVDTAVLPPAWESRLVPILNENTRGVTGWCLDAHDLAFSKLAAGREKDLNFVVSMLKHHLIQSDRVLELIATSNLPTEIIRRMRSFLERRNV